MSEDAKITSMVDFRVRRDEAVDMLLALPDGDPNMPVTGEPTLNQEHPFGYGITEMDVEAFMNIRNWIERACTAQGARTTGAGIGFGQADISIELDGQPYSVSIRPLPK